jgi:hypothetical protein
MQCNKFLPTRSPGRRERRKRPFNDSFALNRLSKPSDNDGLLRMAHAWGGILGRRQAPGAEAPSRWSRIESAAPTK